MGNVGASTCHSKPSRVHVQTDPQAAPMVGQEFRGCGGVGTLASAKWVSLIGNVTKRGVAIDYCPPCPGFFPSHGCPL